MPEITLCLWILSDVYDAHKEKQIKAEIAEYLKANSLGSVADNPKLTIISCFAFLYKNYDIVPGLSSYIAG